MLFTSPLFLFVFLPLLLAIYYLSPNSLHVKNFVALAGSVVFFAWGEPIFVFALIVGTFIDYRASLLIAPHSTCRLRTKRFVLATAICLDVAALVASKYTQFVVVEIINPLGPWLNVHLEPPNIPLVLGISFITFHRISYLVDSFKGRAIPPRGFLDCALYIFLFPQLIAGPIIRYHDIGYQIHDRTHTPEGFLTGFFRFSIGLTKKIVIADPLGLVADKIFSFRAEDLSAPYAWGGLIAYSLQIYFDFSGYSDMAIGLGRMMGFRFPENFNRPYISRSITEFWQRWHISLSNWMRLYLYIPLGGNRVSLPRTYLNLWIVFVISGIWHGASWNFVAWGAYYGLFLSLERAASSSALVRIAVPGTIRQASTLLIVMIGWVLFRSPSLGYAGEYLSAMFLSNPVSVTTMQPWGLTFGNRDLATLVLASIIACSPPVPRLSSWFPATLHAAWSDKMTIQGLRGMVLQFTSTVLLIVMGVAATVSSDYVPFLYFRF
jgi:alginate O-acetyltransferase complex protein AlgI